MSCFHGCVTEEAEAEDGSVKLAVDFDLLRQELSGSIVEGPQERYHPVGRESEKRCLRPMHRCEDSSSLHRDESVDFDTTRNPFIESDNLDALKLLRNLPWQVEIDLHRSTV